MDKVTLQDRRDFPLTTNSLAFMQAAYAALEKLGYIGGDNYIVSGCTVTDTSAAPGYMFLKGILMPFLGGTITTNVKIVKVVTSVNVDAGVREQTSYRAEFGTSTNPDDNVAWADIVRTDTIISLMSQMTALSNRLTDAEDDILVNAQDIQGLDDRIDALELNEIAWTDVTITYGSFNGTPQIRACKIGKVIYITGYFRFSSIPNEDTILFTLPGSFPAFSETCYISAGDANEDVNYEVKALTGTNQIVMGSGGSNSGACYISAAIPVI